MHVSSAAGEPCRTVVLGLVQGLGGWKRGHHSQTLRGVLSAKRERTLEVKAR